MTIPIEQFAFTMFKGMCQQFPDYEYLSTPISKFRQNEIRLISNKAIPLTIDIYYNMRLSLSHISSW